MFRRIVPLFGLLAGLTSAVLAAPAQAQVNIDEGKSAAEMFANDCATCHKTTRGLAVGKNALTLTGFLREHYTASRAQASALAAYVLSSGGSQPAPAAARQKPDAEHARAAVEEPRTREPREPRTAEPKASEPKAGEAETEQPKTEPRPLHVAKPEESTAPVHEAAPVREAAPVAASAPGAEAPNTAELPGVGPTKSAAAPEQSQPAETAPVPRDHIPD